MIKWIKDKLEKRRLDNWLISFLRGLEWEFKRGVPNLTSMDGSFHSGTWEIRFQISQVSESCSVFVSGVNINRPRVGKAVIKHLLKWGSEKNKRRIEAVLRQLVKEATP